MYAARPRAGFCFPYLGLLPPCKFRCFGRCRWFRCVVSLLSDVEVARLQCCNLLLWLWWCVAVRPLVLWVGFRSPCLRLQVAFSASGEQSTASLPCRWLWLAEGLRFGVGLQRTSLLCLRKTAFSANGKQHTSGFFYNRHSVDFLCKWLRRLASLRFGVDLWLMYLLR